MGLKKNSLFGVGVAREQAEVDDFSDTIRMGKKTQTTDSFMTIARIESLVSTPLGMRPKMGWMMPWPGLRPTSMPVPTES